MSSDGDMRVKENPSGCLISDYFNLQLFFPAQCTHCVATAGSVIGLYAELEVKMTKKQEGGQ